MKIRTKERYKELSEHAEVEDDPKKLRKIASEINRILKAEINRLEKKRTQWTQTVSDGCVQNRTDLVP